MYRKDWNHERRRTRDRLLEYDSIIMPLMPHSAGLAMVYPWEDWRQQWEIPNYEVLGEWLYQVAILSGYQGSKEDLRNNFGTYLERNHQEIVFGTLSTFPEIGERNKLYFDSVEKTLYYWANQYIPVNGMLITDTILEGGGA